MYFMVSTDKIEKTTKFAEQHCGNTFVMLSDHSKETTRAYGLLSLGKFAKRWTFYIDKTGAIAKIDKDVKPKNSGADIIGVLNEMGVRTEN